MRVILKFRKLISYGKSFIFYKPLKIMPDNNPTSLWLYAFCTWNTLTVSTTWPYIEKILKSEIRLEFYLTQYLMNDLQIYTCTICTFKHNTSISVHYPTFFKSYTSMKFWLEYSQCAFVGSVWVSSLKHLRYDQN